MYPVATKADTVAYVEGRHNGSLGPHDLKVTYRGSEADDFVDEIVDALQRVLDEWRARDERLYTSDQARDELEGQLSVELHRCLTHLPASVLTDRDFWRYCAACLYDFVMWRQPSKTVTASFPYFGVATNALGRECLPHRMFDRAHIAKEGGDLAHDSDPYALARFGAADVWKSHILRVANGNAPVLVREVLTDVKAGQLKTDVIRSVIKNLRRVRANVLFEVLDQPQARDLLDRETARAAAASASHDLEASAE